MSFKPAPDYWIRIPGGRYRLGLTPEEARTLAVQSAAWKSGKGAEFSLNDRKMVDRAVSLGATTGDPAWVERYLLAHYPAHEMTLAEFSIAKRPVSNREFRQFMADTGETQRPTAWERNGSANQADELPAQGIGWWQAMAFVEWAHARIAFEPEWERAMRGPSHQLFPWGNELLPIGRTIIEQGYLQALPANATTTSEGIEGGVRGSPEWSAGLWEDKTSATEWGEEPAPSWSRMTLGGGADDKVIPSALSRSPGYFGGYGFGSDVASLRLVKADGRAIVKPSASTPREKLAMESVRRFESRVIPQVIELLRGSPIVRDHTISIEPGDANVAKITKATSKGTDSVRAGIYKDGTWSSGSTVAAVSRESIRRVPAEHGVFAWTIQYHLASDGVRARPVTAFHMAFDKSVHRFENRFRKDHADAALAQLTPELVAASILDGFQYYELHADASDSPFR